MPRRRYEEERPIAERLRAFRLSLSYSQTGFAALCGTSRAALASYEELRAPLPWRVFLSLHKAIGISPLWLATGGGSSLAPCNLPALRNLDSDMSFSEVYREHFPELKDDDRMRNTLALTKQTAVDASQFAKRIAKMTDAEMIAAASDPKFLADLARTRDRLSALMSDTERLSAEKRGEEAKSVSSGEGKQRKPGLPKRAGKDSEDSALRLYHSGYVPNEMAKVIPENLGALLSIVRERTKARGAKSALAREIGVTPQRLGEWLNPGSVRQPGAEHTIALLRWVCG